MLRIGCSGWNYDAWRGALLRQHGAALVIADDPERPLPTPEPIASWTFVRFHRGSRGRRGNYSKAELEQWARRIAAWRDGGIDVYAYFNNDWEAFAPRNAELLKRLLGAPWVWEGPAG